MTPAPPGPDKTTKGGQHMTLHKSRSGLTRRQLLARSVAAGAALVVGPGFIAGHDAAWALETTALKPETMATLVQMARDI